MTTINAHLRSVHSERHRRYRRSRPRLLVKLLERTCGNVTSAGRPNTIRPMESASEPTIRGVLQPSLRYRVYAQKIRSRETVRGQSSCHLSRGIAAPRSLPQDHCPTALTPTSKLAFEIRSLIILESRQVPHMIPAGDFGHC